MSSNYTWWQKAVFYQIYPRSFADGNGDGIGDFKGMIDKLDYLKDLGIDAVWLSPHYPSPYVDCGYDIADYENVAPEYGNLQDFKVFLDGLHQRGMRLILDLVLNHTSDQHPWFLESKSSRENPKHDWYIWKPGKGGKEPNNWYSTFGGSAWKFDPVTGEYYYHFFFKEQPDLNWKNPEVKQAMFNSTRFWLDMGVDGFRLDAVGTIFEDERYLDHRADFTQTELMKKEFYAQDQAEKKEIARQWQEMFQYQHDMPEVHQIMRELRQVIDEYADRVLVGETDELSFYGNGRDELHLNFNFPLMRVKRMSADHVKANQKERLAQLPADAWPCNTLGNHDVGRMYNQFGDDVHDELITRQNLLLLLTLKGTPFLYYGEEIGMRDYDQMDIRDFRDTLAIAFHRMARELVKISDAEAMKFASAPGRDKCRTPMQWSGQANAGFSPETIRPWLPVNPNYLEGVNVESELQRNDSLLQYYRSLIIFRKSHEALQTGEFSLDESVPEKVVKYSRFNEKDSFTLLFNFSDQMQSVNLGAARKVLFEAMPGQTSIMENRIELAPFAAAILQ